MERTIIIQHAGNELLYPIKIRNSRSYVEARSIALDAFSKWALSSKPHRVFGVIEGKVSRVTFLNNHGIELEYDAETYFENEEQS